MLFFDLFYRALFEMFVEKVSLKRILENFQEQNGFPTMCVGLEGAHVYAFFQGN